MKTTIAYKPLLWLLAMVYYVPAAALCINPPLFAARSLLILFAWFCLLLIPYVFVPKKIVYRMVVLLFFLDGFINLGHWLVLKCPLNVSSLFILLNTNGREAVEFVSLKASLRWLLMLPYLLLAVQAFRRIPVFSWKSLGVKIAVGVLGVFALLFFCEALFNGRFVRTALPDTERALFSFSNEMKAYRGVKKRTLHKVEAVCDTQACVSVLILGESCNRNHLSLYGYGRNTSPKLCGREDILVFTDVITPYSATMNSVVNSLSNSNMDTVIPADSCIHLLDVYRSAGFKTFWISNQSPIGVWDNVVYNFAQVADHCFFENRAANSSFESTQLASYDAKLFEPLQRVLRTDTASRKWIVLHLMGSHSQYNKRYPSAFECYRGGKDKKQKTIDAYDNSIRYNDYVVDSLFNLLHAYAKEHKEVRVHAIYLSDHGENVYDAGETAGHDFADTIPYANLEIPFIFWMPRERQQLSDRFHLLKQRVHTPFMTDDLFHLLIELDGIRTPYLQPQRSLFHTDYHKERARRLMDNRVYCNNRCINN